MNSPQKTGKRVTMRLIEQQDVSSVLKLYSNEIVCEFYDLAPISKPSQAAGHIDKWLSNFEKGLQVRYAICENNDVIGTCGLYSIYRHQNRANIGFDLLPKKWNQGYMTEALTLFLNICFEEWNFHRIQALILPSNISSQKLLSRLGFNYEGLLRDYEIWSGRGYVDLQIHALMKSD